MKTTAPRGRPSASAPRARDLSPRSPGPPRASPAAARTAPPAREPAAAPASRSLLDRLAPEAPARAPTALSRAWGAATAGEPGDLPRRSEIEARLGRRVGPVEVYSGPAARSLLDRLQARSAVRGRQILLRDRAVDPMTLTHEVVHVLQAGPETNASAGTPAASGAPAPLSEGHVAEREAEAVARALWGPARVGGAPSISARLRAGTVALRRQDLPFDFLSLIPGLAELDAERRPARGRGGRRRTDAPEPVESDAPEADAEADRDAAEAPAEADAAGAEAAEATDGTDTGAEGEGGGRTGRRTGRAAGRGGPRAPEGPAREGEARRDGDARRGGEAMEGEVARPGREPAETRTAATPGCEINPRARFDDFLHQVQGAWDRGADTADSHAVEPCPEAAVGEGRHPFARGPPSELPETREETLPEDPQLAPLDEAEIARAREQLTTSIGASRAGEVDRSGLDPEVDRLREGQSRATDREVSALIGEDPPARGEAPPTVDLTGAADPATADAEVVALRAGIDRGREDAGAHSREDDFGEDRLGPREDPTAGLDLDLEGLTPPAVDVEALVAETNLDRIPTADNAGHTPLDELAVVREQDLAAAGQRLDLEAEAQAQIDDQIASSEADLDAACARAGAEREALDRDAQAGVDERRAEWTAELDDHATRRAAEGEALKRDKTGHVTRLREDAEHRAADTMTAAETEADRRWRDTEARARERAGETGSRSLWEEAVDFVRAQIAAIMEGIRAFIDACRRAVDALLDAAARVAHATVEAARVAITRTLDLLRAGLNLIADNLPGELGRIARGWRDRIATFLDGVQAAVDAAAAALHEVIDTGITALRDGLQRALDALANGLAAIATGIDALLSEGLMAFLRAQFPTIAALIDDGLLGPIRQAGEALEVWVQDLLERSGLLEIEAVMMQIEHSPVCEPITPEQQADMCRAFEQMLQDLLGELDGLLQSPWVQDLQRSMTASRDEALDEQVGALESIFTFAQDAASEVLEWWNGIEAAVNAIYQVLGSYACAIWRHIAEILGLPIDLDPITALRQALERLWTETMALIQPVIDGLLDVWRWIREETFVADLIELIQWLGRVWDQLGDLWDTIVAEGEAWLVALAEAADQAIMEPLRQLLATVAGIINAVTDAIAAFARGMMEALEAFVAQLLDIPILGAIVRLLRALLSPLRTLSVLALRCVLLFLRMQADFIANLFHYLRVFADILVGLVMALAAPPLSIALFLAGNVWLHLIPDCYKLAIINFLLDVAIRVITFFPEPADIALFVMQRGALRFLKTLRDDRTDRKVRAVDMVARIFAGDLEVFAGMLFGVLEALWDSTIGLVIMLVQVAAWLIGLPFRMLGLTSDGGDEVPEGEAPDAETMGDEAEGAGEEIADDVVVDEADDVAIGEPLDEEEPPPETVEEPAPVDSGSTTGGFDPTRPPEAPPALQQVRAVLEAFVADRLSREDLERALHEFRQSLRQMVDPMAEQAAEALLNGLTAEGAAFTIGRAIGYVVGLVLIIVLLAIFTGPGAAAGGAAEVAGATASTTGRTGVTGMRALAQALPRIRAVIQPMLEGFARIVGPRLQAILRPIWPWIDDILRWLRNVIRGVRAFWRSLPPWMRDMAGAWFRWKGIAEGQAGVVWQELSADMNDEAVSEGTLRLRLIEIRLVNQRIMPRGLKLRLRAELDEDDEEWRLKATVKRSLFSSGPTATRFVSASGHAGPGWLAMDEDDDPWFTTAEDQSERHRRVLEMVDQMLERAAAMENEPGTDLRTVYDRLVDDDVAAAEEQARTQLLENITLNILERVFHTGTDERGLPALIFDCIISPNHTDEPVTVSTPALPDATAPGGAAEEQALVDFETVVRQGVADLDPQQRGLGLMDLTDIVERARRTSAAQFYELDAQIVKAGNVTRVRCGSRFIAKRTTVELPRLRTGRQNDPIPFLWFKPIEAYPRVDLSPERGDRDELLDLWGPRPLDGEPDVPDRLQVIRITGSHDFRVPADLRQDLGGIGGGGEATLGVAPAYQPRVGMVMWRVQGGPRITEDFPTPLTIAYRALLRVYGWHRPERYAIDHVQDFGLSGLDGIPNLWPLESRMNLRANQVYYQPIRFENADGRMQESRPLMMSGLYFRISQIRLEPPS